MPKINVYVPQDLADAIKGSEITVSHVCQDALREALRKPTPVETEGNGVSGFKLVKITDSHIDGDVLFLNNLDGQTSARIIIVLSSIEGWVESMHLTAPQVEILLSGGHVIRAVIDKDYEPEPDESPLDDLNQLLWDHFSPVHMRLQPGD